VKILKKWLVNFPLLKLAKNGLPLKNAKVLILPKTGKNFEGPLISKKVNPRESKIITKGPKKGPRPLISLITPFLNLGP